MHVLVRSAVLVTVMACSATTTAPQPLDGVWSLQTNAAQLTPRTMRLSQLGGAINGTGSAMGVDRAIPISMSGSFSPATSARPPLVDLTFRFADNGQLAGQFNGTLS